MLRSVSRVPEFKLLYSHNLSHLYTVECTVIGRVVGVANLQTANARQLQSAKCVNRRVTVELLQVHDSCSARVMMRIGRL